MNQVSIYQRLGGAFGVRVLTRRFYGLMDELPEAYGVRKIHPEDLGGSEDSLFKFLSGWFGGPPLYIAERGHPRLRMRHAPYTIGETEREQWMLCMRMALDEQVEDAALRESLKQQAFQGMADHLVNAPGSSAQTCIAEAA
jgi:hemoglobin